MRVLVVTHEFAPCVWGGLGVYVTHLVRELRDRVRIRVLCVAGETAFGRTFDVPDVPAHRLAVRSRQWPLPHLELFLRMNRYVRRHAGEFDLVHDHTRLVSGGPRPLVLTVHSTEEQERAALDRPAPWSGRPAMFHAGMAVTAALERWTIGRAGTLVTVSAEMAGWLGRRFGRTDIPLARPGLEPDGFRPAPTGVEPDVDVLFVGRFHVRKGMSELLAALDRLPGALRVVLCGGFASEKEERRLGEWIARTPHRVEVRTDVAHPEMPDIYRRARLVVVPSRYEPFGTAAAEALACGTPVIASSADGLPELVKDGENGRIVPPRDPVALAGAIAALLGDEPTRARMSRAAPARVTGLRWSATAEATLAAYSRALS